MQFQRYDAIEQTRLARLHGYQILDTPPEAEFDQLLDDVLFILEASGGYISFMEEGRQWFKASVGLHLSELPRERALCNQALLTTLPLMVANTLEHEQFRTLPLVTEASLVRSFLALPLITADGFKLGTFCVFSQEKRVWTLRDTDILLRFSGRVMQALERRFTHAQQTMDEAFAAIKEHASDGFILLNSQEHVLEFNPLAVSITGVQWSVGELFTPTLFFQDDSIPDIHKGNVFLRWDGQVWFKVTAAPLPSQDWILLIIEDVTHHLQHQFGLEAKVYREQTREEGERNALYEYLQGRIKDHNCSVMHLDLNQFRVINETLGYQAGDTLLRQVAVRLRQTLRGNDRVYRLSGDEFVLILAGQLEANILEMIACRIEQALRRPFQWEEENVQLRATIGITPTEPSESVDGVLQRAETLMQQAKQQQLLHLQG